VPYDRDLNTRSFPGSHGAVFKAFSKSSRIFGSNREVFAIKEIHLPNTKAQKRVKSEIQFLWECKHRNILRLTDAYEIEEEDWTNTIFLVTEPWAPMSLQMFFESVAGRDPDLHNNCPWYNRKSVKPWPGIIEQCIAGLQYLHEHQIRYKDLKPANILLRNEETQDHTPGVWVIIADLGISKRFAPATETSFTAGTYSFLAPEQIEKIGSTHKSDIFSLGCCFSMIEAVVCAGSDGLLAIGNAAMGTDSCQFAKNIRLVHDTLE
jgi:serine/threonine protein kinase